MRMLENVDKNITVLRYISCIQDSHAGKSTLNIRNCFAYLILYLEPTTTMVVSYRRK